MKREQLLERVLRAIMEQLLAVGEPEVIDVDFRAEEPEEEDKPAETNEECALRMEMLKKIHEIYDAVLRQWGFRKGEIESPVSEAGWEMCSDYLKDLENYLR